ncbi:MAG: sugar ABC transporter ATP-binding protein [Chloroflexi bacterium]|nr:sugar ABC transporter ATP-binding protein [Chloroflexota bacterium]MDL1884076.1 sugar ABC transporter ATP-binding protein [Anaerolineae bacterium CFX8]
MQNQPILQVKGVSKAFPGVQALSDVDFEVYPGEVVALLGENGAGKSTLMKILAGAYQKDSGQIYLNGQEIELTSPHHAQTMGISIIYQEFNLVPTQTVAANIFTGREPLYGGAGRVLKMVNKQEMERAAQEMLDVVGAHVKPTDMIRSLPVAERQLVEIAKALSFDSRVIIMDEPTSALGDEETQNLFKIVRSLKDQGRAVIFITHRLKEVFEIADRIVVLRDGRLVGSVPAQDTSIDGLISMMVGRSLDQMYQKETAEIGDVVMRVQGLTRYGAVEDVSFELRRGEILGFAGLVGAGRTETARLLFGADALDGGEIWIDGQKVSIHSPEDAIRAGISFVPEDRGNQGLVLLLSVFKNEVLPTMSHFTRFGLLDGATLQQRAQEYVSRLNVRTPSLEQKVMFLSGGNQQKVVLAKWLMSNPKVLILDEPTRGIDVGAKSEIYALMSQLARSGIGIIMISSELPEILAMSDRVLVMCEGRVTGIIDRQEATQEAIMAYATRHASVQGTI